MVALPLVSRNASGAFRELAAMRRAGRQLR
jgi:hypothetical protein